jgi:hypothetical protein
LKFTLVVFLIKDWHTRSTLLKGECHGSLFHIPAAPHFTKFAFRVNKSSLARWHERLGHLALQIVQNVLRDFNLPFQQEPNKDIVCCPCQQVKSHQLPYSKSSSVSNHPLELIYSNVWGPVPGSVGRF